MKLILKNLDQVVQVCDSGERYKCASAQNEVATMERRPDGVGCFVAVGEDGKIAAVGWDDELSQEAIKNCPLVRDLPGHSVLPGFIDPHTHPVWAGDRTFEFELKMAGASYMDIHGKGGGIYFTVNATREASHEQLVSLLEERLNCFASCGTTVAEVKTGYGLTFESELKMLRVIEQVKAKHAVELVTTLLSAHAIPQGMNLNEATQVNLDIIDRLASENMASAIDFIDVFCEKGVFGLPESKLILERGREKLKCQIAFHGEELTCLNSGEMAGELEAKSISHCEFISEKGIEAICKSKTAAIICPTTAYLLRLEPPPVRQMISRGVIVSIGSDFNPNAYCYSMPFAMNLAVIYCKMSLKEALVASTINGAYSLGLERTHGTIEVGKFGDIILLSSPDWRQLMYQMGDTRRLIKAVLKRGQVISGSL